MATITYYLTDTLASGSAHMALQEGGSAPTTARISTGWIVGTTAATVYSRMDAQTERANATLTSTVQPNGGPDNTLGDCFRTATTLNGSFAAGNWAFDWKVQGETRVTSTTGGRLRFRMWRSVNADGSSATEITAATQTSTLFAALANSASQAIAKTYDPGAFTLANEYLFIQHALSITTAGDNSTADVHLCVGTGNSIVTTDFTVATSLPPLPRGRLWRKRL